jgi:UDP-N-acetylglucosamine 2-epimerase (non-hydrolysing)
MPEETNRVVTDRVSDVLFIHSPEARDHLLDEGREEASIHYVGNTMIDTLMAMRERIDELETPARHGLAPGDYLVVTLHRPALVDGPLLSPVAEALRAVARLMPVVFPVHPRTRAQLLIADPGLAGAPGVTLLEPIGYLEFLDLVARSAGVLTDSGGIQEETTFLGVPCLTLRENTERPITVSMGTNMLLGLKPERIREAPAMLERVRERANQVPPLWDGRAAERIVEVLASGRVAQPPADASLSTSAISPASSRRL